MSEEITSIFDKEYENKSETFSQYCEKNYFPDERNWIDNLWRRFEAYADPDFLRRLVSDEHSFHSLIWEMQLGVTLLDAGYDLQKNTRADAPDLCIVLNGQKVWIECVIPERGKSLGEVQIGVREIDNDGNILRVTNAISEKVKQHNKHIKRGSCSQKDPFIIALHAKNLDSSICDDTFCNGLKSVYPVGNLSYILDKKDFQIVGHNYGYKSEVLNKNGRSISTQDFLNDKYRCVTGLLFSEVTTLGKYYGQETHRYVPNVMALNKIEEDFSKFAQSYMVQDVGEDIKITLLDKQRDSAG